MVRGELPVALRITLKALVVIDVHARDVVSGLVNKNVQSLNEFEWAS
jgi:dynein heavy chain